MGRAATLFKFAAPSGLRPTLLWAARSPGRRYREAATPLAASHGPCSQAMYIPAGAAGQRAPQPAAARAARALRAGGAAAAAARVLAGAAAQCQAGRCCRQLIIAQQRQLSFRLQAHPGGCEEACQGTMHLSV